MNWTGFNTHGHSRNQAFETMCNIVFESWCRSEYGDKIKHFSFVNGAGGDGGVEAYAVLDDDSVVAVQSKWFPDKITQNEIKQIQNSYETALNVRPSIRRYIVCIPRDLGSTKIVAGNKTAKDTEESRWLSFAEQCKTNNPNVELELWSETRLQEKLTTLQLHGVYSFWFEDNQLDDQFELSVNKAVDSWAKDKYVPDLYSEGFIHHELDRFLGSRSITEKRYKTMNKLLQRMKELKRAYSDVIKLEMPDTEKPLREKIDADIRLLEGWIAYLDEHALLVKEGQVIDFNKETNLQCSRNDFKESSLHLQKYFHFNSVEKHLSEIDFDFLEFELLFNSKRENKLIFLGDQGSGKTTGIVAEVKDFLTKKTHLPVLVHAKDFSTGDSWSDIIQKSLGVSNTRSESVLFSALKNYLLLQSDNMDEEYGFEPHCVICVDGIDEGDWEFWKEKIGEVEAYQKDYAFLRFVFLSRPYVFEDRYDLSYRHCFSSLPADGDVDYEEICEKYFTKFSIDIGTNDWIKHLFRNPLSVKLFCDIYHDSIITDLDKNTLVITSLFKKKMEVLEEKYKSARGSGYIPASIYNSLCIIADLFAETESVPIEELTSTIQSQYSGQENDIIRFFVEEGFLYSRTYQGKDDFSPRSVKYYWGIQPAFDYLIARKTFSKLEQGDEITVNYTTGIYQMLALIVAEEKGRLLNEYTNLAIDSQIVHDLTCYMLANVSVNVAKLFVDYVREEMRASIDSFRDIVNRVIIPVSPVCEHPLGATFLDQFLREFNSAAERDIWWSIPAYLRGNSKSLWKTFFELDFENISIGEDDMPITRPLVVAWSLASVSNEVRRLSRMKLMQWGILHPMSFLDLLVKIVEVDDEQIVEDVFSIAYGIALDNSTNELFLREASVWIVENVFSTDGLIHYENSVVRFYAGGIIKLAVNNAAFEVDDLIRIAPPFKHDRRLLPIAVEATKAERMGGYGVIDYDLARYVLCDHLDLFFGWNYSRNTYDEEVEDFIEYYKNTYGLTDLQVDGLIISMAYAFLINHGWNSEVFLNSSDEDSMGVDSSIKWTFSSATHGSISEVMSVAEKFVWLARHQIEAYLADLLPLHNHGNDDEKEYLRDYSQIESFHNMYQEYANARNRGLTPKWFHLEQLANLENDNMDKTQIENWIQNDSVPDFGAWITDNEGFITLSAYTSKKNDYSGIEEVVWISSGIVSQHLFGSFMESLNLYFDERYDLVKADSFHAAPDVRCCSPVEACEIFSNLEVEQTTHVIVNDESIDIEKLVSECLCLDEMEAEKSFLYPSNITRRMMGIVSGDGYSYYDENNVVVAEFHKNGGFPETSQEILLANSKLLENALSSEQYKLFWSFRVHKCPSSKAYERFPGVLHDSDVTYIVWREGTKFKYVILKEINPPDNRAENTDDVESLLQDMLNQYSLHDDIDNNADEQLGDNEHEEL